MSSNPASRSRARSNNRTGTINAYVMRTRARTAAAANAIADDSLDAAIATTSAMSEVTAPPPAILRPTATAAISDEPESNSDDDFSVVSSSTHDVPAAEAISSGEGSNATVNNTNTTVPPPPARRKVRFSLTNDSVEWWQLSPARRHRMRLQLRDLANDINDEITEATRPAAETSQRARSSVSFAVPLDTIVQQPPASEPVAAYDVVTEDVATPAAADVAVVAAPAAIVTDDAFTSTQSDLAASYLSFVSTDNFAATNSQAVAAVDAIIATVSSIATASAPETGVQSAQVAPQSDHIPASWSAAAIPAVDFEAVLSSAAAATNSAAVAAVDAVIAAVARSTASAVVSENDNAVANVDDAPQEYATPAVEPTMSNAEPAADAAVARSNSNSPTSAENEVLEVDNPDVALHMDSSVIEVLASPEVPSAIRIRPRSSSEEPIPMRKRRRVTTPSSTPEQPSKENVIASDDDEDTGSTCAICLDSWEMSGEHRLTSLKCGHLFGESCIKKWLSSAETYGRYCPSCKSKVNRNDLRPIYAKRICVIDNSKEIHLQHLLDEEISKVSALKQDVALLKLSLQSQKRITASLEAQLKHTEVKAHQINKSIRRSVTFHLDTGLKAIPSTSSNNIAATSSATTETGPASYKLSRECTINICDAPGCRVIVHSPRHDSLIVSQRATGMFTGFGARFIDVASGRLTSFMHMANRQIRDIALDKDQELISAASMDRSVKVYSLNSRGCVSTITPTEDKPIWSVVFDRTRQQLFYAGTQNGSAFVYDLRYPSVAYDEHRQSDDCSPVISIASVSARPSDFPLGGFLVCKLQSLWFYEYTSQTNRETIATRLPICGPFVSMDYVDETLTILVTLRPTSNRPMSLHVYLMLRKVDQTTTVNVASVMAGSTVQAVMTRSTQIQMPNATVVAAYMQDKKTLQTWQVRPQESLPLDQSRETADRMQTLPIAECVMDTCAVYVPVRERLQNTYLAALSETKCWIYKVLNTRGAE